MAMISNALITGGDFRQNIRVDQRQVQRSALDRLQDAAAHKAFHNSGERFEPPKCHPNTRLAVRDNIEKWALCTDPDTRETPIMWLSGAAGAGKSAIAQTMAEDFHSRGLLAASFFFGRSDPTRNHARSLVATIAYQLHSLLPPPEQSGVLAVIDRDPLVFTKSLHDQFEALIADPLRPSFQRGFWSSIHAPRLIIIDGLDECLGCEMQRNVLRMLSASACQSRSPFRFLLVSRPEHDIQAMFSSPDFRPIHTRLFLDDTYLPDHDIELFLRDQFEECRTIHPFRHLIPPNWPSDDIVAKLTDKSSGQFIYASVVSKYVKSSRHRPDHRLDVVLNLRPTEKDLPFSELDALYSHVFSQVEDLERVLHIISFYIMAPSIPSDCTDGDVVLIERIFGLKAGEGLILLCDLASVIGYEGGFDEDGTFDHRSRLQIHHASLTDYLLDQTRSKEYHIDVGKHCSSHAAACFQFVSTVQPEDAFAKDTTFYALSYFAKNHPSVELTDPLYEVIRRFSISRTYGLVPLFGPSHSMGPGVLLFPSHVMHKFLLALLKFLNRSDSAKHLELYQHHQSQYDLFLREIMSACLGKTPDISAPLIFAVVAYYPAYPTLVFHSEFLLFGFSDFDDTPASVVLWPSVFCMFCVPPYEYFADFLRDPERSREFCAGPKLFAQAATHCLLYLCDHTAPSQKSPPRVSPQQRLRRKQTPWKWRRRVLREDIRGPRVTPWLWVRNLVNLSEFSKFCVLHRRTNDLIYATYRYRTLTFPTDDPVVMYRVHSEKYNLALRYLNYFLPRAAKSDELVHMCKTLTFASLSRNFPRKSARARSRMRKYAARWEERPRDVTSTPTKSALFHHLNFGVFMILLAACMLLYAVLRSR